MGPAGEPSCGRAEGARPGIEIAFLPFRAPELNLCEDLWRQLNGVVAADRAYASVDVPAEQAVAWLDAFTLFDRPLKSGLLSSMFQWLPT